MTGSSLARVRRIGGFGLLLLLCSLPGRLAAAETYTPPWPDLTVGEARNIVAGGEGEAGAQLFAGYAVGALNGFYTGAVYVAGSERITCFDPDSVFVTPKELILWAVDRVSAETEAPKESLLGPVILAGLQRRFACAPGEIDLTFREEDLSAEERRDQAFTFDRIGGVDVYTLALEDGLLGGKEGLPAEFSSGYVLGSFRILALLSADYETESYAEYCFDKNVHFGSWHALRELYLDGVAHLREYHLVPRLSQATDLMTFVLSAARLRNDDPSTTCE